MMLPPLCWENPMPKYCIVTSTAYPAGNIHAPDRPSPRVAHAVQRKAFARGR